MRKRGFCGRVSALVAIATILVMVAAPFTVLNFDGGCTSASPLVEVDYNTNGGDSGNGTLPPPTTTSERDLDPSEINFVQYAMAVATVETFANRTGGPLCTNANETLSTTGTINDDKEPNTPERGYYINTSVTGGGSISPAGSVFVSSGGNQTFTITPKSGERIMDVLVDGESVGRVNQYAFTGVNRDHTIEVRFSTTVITHSYYITAKAGDGATVDPSGTASVLARDKLTVSWTALSGFYVSDVVIDGISHPELADVGSYTFRNVQSNHTFELLTERGNRDIITLTVNTTGGQGYAEFSLDNGLTYARYNGPHELEPGASVLLRAVSNSGYEFARWEGTVSGTNGTIGIWDITSSVEETLVLKGYGERSGGGIWGDDGFFSSTAFYVIAATLAILLIGSLLTMQAALYKGRFDVVMFGTEAASVVGKSKARANHPYKFTVGGEALVAYRVGNNVVWKEPAKVGGVYEIPAEDVVDTLTIRTR